VRNANTTTAPSNKTPARIAKATPSRVRGLTSARRFMATLTLLDTARGFAVSRSNARFVGEPVCHSAWDPIGPVPVADFYFGFQFRTSAFASEICAGVIRFVTA